MRWFISYLEWHKFPRANTWTPCNDVIDVHPVEWISRNSRRGWVVLTWWTELKDGDPPFSPA